jgi:hypothetical protein
MGDNASELNRLLDDIYGHSYECTLAIVRAVNRVHELKTYGPTTEASVRVLEKAEADIESAVQELVQIRFHIEDYGEEADSVSDDVGTTTTNGNGTG